MKGLIIRVGIALVVLAAGFTFLRAIYLVVTSKFDKTNVPCVAVSSPSPVALPAHRAFSRTGRISWRETYQDRSSGGNTSQFPCASMSPSQGLFATSRAQVHIIGGGGGAAYAANSSGNTSSRGISYGAGGVTMPMTHFSALASARKVSQPEASEAPQMAAMASSPIRHAPGPPNPPDPLDEEHQLVEHPIGDAVLPLSLLLIGYALATALRRRRKA